MLSIKHSNELQALRGIAALCVLIHHALRVLGPTPLVSWVADVLLNAHAAVVIFFVLSGFVLSKSLLSRGFSREEMIGYYIRRIFRIYPALWCACTLGCIYLLFFQGISSPHFADWASRHYSIAQFDIATLILSYAALLPYLDPPLWTILIELACSGLLPFLLILFTRKPRSIVPVVMILAAACFAEQNSLKGILTNFIHFSIGAVLAVRGTRDMPTGSIIWLALAIMVMFRQLNDWSYTAAVPSLVEGVMAYFVIGGIANGTLKCLSHHYLQWLGDISYSVYLFHLPIAYAIARLLDHYIVGPEITEFAPLMVAVGTLLITLPLATLSYRYVELPGIALGRRGLRAIGLEGSAAKA